MKDCVCDEDHFVLCDYHKDPSEFFKLMAECERLKIDLASVARILEMQTGFIRGSLSRSPQEDKA